MTDHRIYDLQQVIPQLTVIIKFIRQSKVLNSLLMSVSTLNIIQVDLSNTVLINHATLDPGHRRYCDSPVTDEDSASSFTQVLLKKDRSQQGTYAVARIFRHVGKGSKLMYVVKWYGYTKTDDTAEPPRHINQRFIGSYWNRVLKKKQKKYTHRWHFQYCAQSCISELLWSLQKVQPVGVYLSYHLELFGSPSLFFALGAASLFFAFGAASLFFALGTPSFLFPFNAPPY